MNQITNAVVDVFKWIKSDFDNWPTRFVLEITAWFASIACSIIMAVTLPHPPFFLLYPMFISQCVIFAWAAWTRRSFGMLANYALLITIDSIALARLTYIEFF